METILAIDLGKRNSVFCRLNSRSLKPGELKVYGTFLPAFSRNKYISVQYLFPKSC